MSVTQSYDFNAQNNAPAVGGGAPVPNADFDLKDAQLDEASAGGEGTSGLLSGGIGNITQNATQICPDHREDPFPMLLKRLSNRECSLAKLSQSTNSCKQQTHRSTTMMEDVQIVNQLKQGADSVANAGKGIVEMGGSLFSGLKRGFSKTSDGTGGE